MRRIFVFVALAIVSACAGSAGPVAPASPPAARRVAAEPMMATIDPATAAAIRQTALDYIEGWYDGDIDRMTRSLHPNLAKRTFLAEGGTTRLWDMNAAELIAATGRGQGKDTPADRRLKDVTILDVFENAASVKLIASDWIDYFHMAKLDGRWVIVNVLWEPKPKPGA